MPWMRSTLENFTVPASSPDLKPIEKIFHTAKWSLNQDALDRYITREDFAAFFTKFKTVLESIPVDVLDRTSFHGQENQQSY